MNCAKKKKNAVPLKACFVDEERGGMKNNSEALGEMEMERGWER